jgi:hypothetical protein
MSKSLWLTRFAHLRFAHHDVVTSLKLSPIAPVGKEELAENEFNKHKKISYKSW